MKFNALFHSFMIIILLSGALSAAPVHHNDDDHAAITAEDAASLRLEFTLSNLETQSVQADGQNAALIQIPGEGKTLEYGKPVLPLISRFVIVPPTVGLELDVSIESQRRVQADLEPALCLDAQLSPLNISDHVPVDKVYPPVVAEMSEPMLIRGLRIVKVTTYPVQWDPETREYIHNEQVNVTIRYTDSEPVNPTTYSIERYRSQDFLKFIDGFVMNSESISRDNPDEHDPLYYGHYLVVSNDRCYDFAEEWIEWRRKSGYLVDVLIPDEEDFEDTHQEIRELYFEHLEPGEVPIDNVLLIGDLTGYDHCGQEAEWILIPPQGNTCWDNDVNHADYLFACMDGEEDQHPDVGIARWASGTEDLMELTVGKTMAYEAYPDMDDPEWFERGAVYSQHYGNAQVNEWHVSLHTNTRWAEGVLNYCGYDDIRYYERYEWDRLGAVVGPWLRDILNEGASIMLGRAQNYFWRNHFNGVNANTKFPMIINAANQSQWSSWWMWRTGDGNNLKGPVSCTFHWGDLPIALTSAVWMEMVRNVMLQDIPIGWAYSGAITAIEGYFPNAEWHGGTDYYSGIKTDFNSYGDPGLLPWKGIPRVVQAEFPETISAYTRLIPVHVTDVDGNEVQGARVTFYVEDDEFMQTHLSDENGNVEFIIDNDVDFDDNDAFLTITGRDILPLFEEIRIREHFTAIEVIGCQLEEIDGNDNGEVNPGETLSLRITALNTSVGIDMNEVSGVISSESPWLEVEDNEIEFGDIPAGEIAEGEQEIVVHIHSSCPDAVKQYLNVEFTSDDHTFNSVIILESYSPRLEVNRIIGDGIIGLERQNLSLAIKNGGGFRSAPGQARLSSNSTGLSVIDGLFNFDAIDPGEEVVIDERQISIMGTAQAIPGSRHQVMVVFDTAEDFIDTSYFDIQVGEIRENAPQGPDNYGYVCFDDTDEEWEAAPEYEWIEICPFERDADFEGQDCFFNGDIEFDIGESTVVEMGMTTQFYGQLYDHITICSNGFIAMGDQGRITNPQNWPMERGMGGGVGMIAPFWDWLDIRDDADVFYYYDEEEGRFIIEWYKLRHHEDDQRVDLTFQVVLYDHEVWITETGDQDILFQYQEIHNERGQVEGLPRQRNNPYASVGISNPRGDTGLGYTWNNEYPLNCAPLENRRAIRYTTQVRHQQGAIEGVVRNFATGDPIEGAVVGTGHGFIAETDENGFYRIPNALAEVEFPLSAFAEGYNDSTVLGLNVGEGEVLEVDFNLLHPEFVPSAHRIEVHLGLNEEEQRNFEISNTGNGPLDYRTEARTLGGANANPWEIRGIVNVGEILDDSRIQGGLFIDGHYYVAGSNDRRPQIYVLNRNGDLVRQFPQINQEGSYGHKDLAWDGQWIWGSGGDMVYAYDLEGNLMLEFEGPYNPNNNFAWDTRNEVMWMSSTTTDIVAVDREGNEIRELDRRGMRVYGLSYYPEDPDGCYLYMIHKDSEIADHIVIKMNPENGDTTLVTVLDEALEAAHNRVGRPIGVEITGQYDNYSWIMLQTINDGSDDFLALWQMDMRQDWFDLAPTEGRINAGEEQEFTLTFDSSVLPVEDIYEAEYRFYHNAIGEEFILPISMVVGDADGIVLDMVQGWNMISINVVPEHLDVRDLMRPLTNIDQLTILKDNLGRMYIPGHNFCNIPRWEVDEGYQIYLTENASLEIFGDQIDPQQPIALREGWNMISYFPEQPTEATIAVANIRDDLEILKNGWGRFYVPEFEYSNIGDMHEGQGYQCKMSDAADLVYSLDEQLALVRNTTPLPSRWTPIPTASNMSLLLSGNPQMKGLEVGAFSPAGTLVGSGVFDERGLCGFAVWGDDASTDAVEGSLPGEAVKIQIWDGTFETDAMLSSPVFYKQDEFIATELYLENLVPQEFSLSVYPNPFNSHIKLSYALPQANSVAISIYDISGRLVQSMHLKEQPAGWHSFSINAQTWTSGIYYARIVAGGHSVVKKVVCVK